MEGCKMKKRYYLAMRLIKQVKVRDSSGIIHDVPIDSDNEGGVAGIIPVFTNKRKAKKWGTVIEIELFEDSKK